MCQVFLGEDTAFSSIRYAWVYWIGKNRLVERPKQGIDLKQIYVEKCSFC